MGDLQSWPAGSNGGDYSNNNNHVGVVGSQQQQQHPANPDAGEIGGENWRRAEEATQEVIENIQPTALSENRRLAVVDYVQRLFRIYLATEVFPFGSVPLKTYLPDGDIDLTGLRLTQSDDAFANDVRSVLEIEEQNMDSEFEVKDVQYINADVKLVKCLVQNIVVDISFNQIGGLCTLCFLDQVDRLIGKDHLFKRSIILIKAWCYYESRILGAHHGLISTYALETLVLYIFHLFHSSLEGPLAVLYRFLDYYSKFDWDNYCISLYGPVSLSSLPELIAEPPENDGSDLLITKEFLKNCVESFSVSLRGFENNSRNFSKKFLNIVDPLKENNNLGRSVSRGNFYRIRSAFTYGARKLGRILLLPSEDIADEVNMYFTNTLDRHGSGERPDVQDVVPRFSESLSINGNGIGLMSSSVNGEASREVESNSGSAATAPHRMLCAEINSTEISGSEEVNGSRVESDCQWEGSKVSPSTSERCNMPSGKPSPHLHFDQENGHQNGGLDLTNPALSSVSSTMLLTPDGEASAFIQPDSWETESSASSTSGFSNYGLLTSSWNTYRSENSHPGDGLTAGPEGNGANGTSKLNRLSDLNGDYDLHLRCFIYAHWFLTGASGPLYYPVHQSPSFQYRNKQSWDPHWRRSVYTQMNANGVASGLPFSPTGTYPVTQPFMSGAYGIEDLPKPRGTGTYFPNTNYRAYREKERYSPGRDKNPVAANHVSRHRNNVRRENNQDGNLQEKGNQEPPPQLHLPPAFNGNSRGKPSSLEISESSRPALKGTHPTNGSVLQPEGRLAFGSFGSAQFGASSPERGRRLDSVSPRTQGGLVTAASNLQRPGVSSNRERSAQSYQLKDEDDFPPLSG